MAEVFFADDDTLIRADIRYKCIMHYGPQKGEEVELVHAIGPYNNLRAIKNQITRFRKNRGWKSPEGFEILEITYKKTSFDWQPFEPEEK